MIVIHILVFLLGLLYAKSPYESGRAGGGLLIIATVIFGWFINVGNWWTIIIYLFVFGIATYLQNGTESKRGGTIIILASLVLFVVKILMR